MRLNPDCIRAVLMCVESSTNPRGNFLFIFSDPTGFMDGPTIDDPSISINSRPELAGFTEDEVRYHIKQASDAGLLVLNTSYISDTCLIEDLTPLGHDFLANIKKDSNWKKIKSIALDKAGTLSLSVLIEIAKSFVISQVF